MKIIHTGDIHLGSAFAFLPAQKAKIRQTESMDTFRALLRFVKDNKVDAVLIAGDLFDSDNVDMRIKQEVFYLIENAKPTQFYYVQGNHDEHTKLMSAPENLHVFQNGKGFQSYDLGENNILTGANTFDFSEGMFSGLRLDEHKFNILLLHGDIEHTNGKESIPLDYLKERHVDYLALGHIHKPMEQAERLDGRGKYRYCGCLEGRGFDEVGKRGAFLLDIQDGRIAEEKFCSFSKREVREMTVDISNAQNYYDVERSVFSVLSGIEQNVIKVKLVGRYAPTLRKELSLLASRVNERCFFAKIEDESRLFVDLEGLKDSQTEIGEFIKEVGRYEMNEEMRQEVLEIGIKALSGEEIDV